jgi:hypothetical protein
MRNFHFFGFVRVVFVDRLLALVSKRSTKSGETSFRLLFRLLPSYFYFEGEFDA